MKFEFRAFDQRGAFQTGMVEAPTRETALQTLQRQGFLVTGINAKRAWWRAGVLTRVPLKELALFTRQFATLVDAQIPIQESLRALYHQITQQSLREAIFDILNDVTAGLPLSQAFARHPHIFSEFYIQMIGVAEVSGTLSETLLYLSQYLDKELKISGRAKGALVYPALVLAVFIAVMLIIFLFIIPQFVKLFEQSNVPIPALTAIFMGISTFLVEWGVYVLFFSAGLLYITGLAIQAPEGKRVFDVLLLSLPILGRIFQKVYLARFCESFSMLIRGGIPIVQSLDTSARVIANTVYREGLEYTSAVLQRGGSISEALALFPNLFPPTVIQTVATGEKTGQLQLLMRKLSDFYTEEVDRELNILNETLQPVLIIILGVAIGFLELSVLIPIFKLTQIVGSL